MKTPVVFRRWNDGSIIALFVEELGTADPWTCSSYMHIGQHGAADPSHVVAVTKPASESEYRDLRRELEGAPYEYALSILHRIPRNAVRVRRAKLEAIK